MVKLNLEEITKKRNPNNPEWGKLPDWKKKVYVFKFSKGEEKFLKVGITDFREAYDRIMANHIILKQGGEQEWVKTSMYEYFDEIDIMTSAELKNAKAEKIEKIILEQWGDQDVKLPKMKGMSEFRKYNYGRLKQARAILDDARYKG